MEKNIKKIITIVIMVFLLTSIFTVKVLATGDEYSEKMGTIINSSWSDSTEAGNKATTMLTTIIVAVKVIAVAVAIVMLLTIAMKYMMASPGDRADIKKNAIPFVIGAFVLFGASGILTLIQNVAEVFN